MELRIIELPDNGILLYESKHSDGNVVKEHSHQIHQILYVLDGIGGLQLDGQRYELTADRLALIVPHSRHSIYCEEKLTMLVLAFNAQMLEGAVHNELFGKRFAASAMLQPNPLLAAEVRQLLRKMMFEQAAADPLYAWAQRIFLQEILLQLSRSRQGAAITDSNAMRAERIRKYIEQHYFEPLTAGDIAGRMGISARYVNNIFKESYGVTPTQYLMEVRIGVAKSLLLETDKDIVTVCFEVGFENVPTFYRAFRNMVKLSPMKFRKQHEAPV
ncbi:helix-turn-helix domain-containing protein [Paenibacillus thalictri]|uniref:AraC family transcriptional regulator n=1 Tax=Paenibacillus thalictri TaxID=2527873 RepID=A0A4Q9DT15_9BACL|nr:AraC family transcriptional regulator [Paenibacillus thalictri]TBL79386.1 AraC family transcriptional regulator [Paenibacillus thalictri]